MDSPRVRRIVFERLSSGRWVASVPSMRNCVAGGRTLDEARRRAVKNATDRLGNTECEFADTIHLPKEAENVLRRSREARKRAEESRADARVAVQDAITMLTRSLGMSVRDVSELLGLSHQRVQQVGARLKGPAARMSRASP